MAIICNECGFPLSGNENKCPKCGNPIHSNNSDSLLSPKTDNWDYTQYREGIFQHWYFKCKKKDEADSYGALNDTLLLFNLIFRAIWTVVWPLILIWIVCVLFSLSSSAAGIPYASYVIIILGIFITIFLLLFYLIPNAIQKFWVPFHRTWRRINKRYWINIHKAIKENDINSI